MPRAGVWVVLHAIGQEGGNPVDSMRTDPQGRFRLGMAVTDTSAIYLVSTTYDGITYFSRPVSTSGDHTVLPIVVYDTSSAAPPIHLAQRHVVVRLPGPDGTRRVLELLVLQNAGTRTRISPDSITPVWSERVADGAVQVEIGESDVSADAITARGDTVAVTAPIQPGEKQVLFTYVLPANRRTLVLPIGQAVGDLNVMLEDTTATLVSGPVVARGKEVFEDAVFARFEGTNVPPGSRVEIRFAAAPFPIAKLWIVLVVVVGVGLAIGLVVWLRHNAGRVVTPELLAQEIAALDVEYETRSAPTPAEEATYRARRSALKARLDAVLAASRPRS